MNEAMNAPNGTPKKNPAPKVNQYFMATKHKPLSEFVEEILAQWQRLGYEQDARWAKDGFDRAEPAGTAYFGGW
ncbi:MAG: hypothetical protein PHV34_07490 [Verrucomicrobiae bacterium]|nr:hypothetical protein [Verrucomicrobiae bacterium]